MKEKFFSDTTFILAFLTSASYVLGVTYCQGFLREFGLDDTQFTLSLDRYLFQGFVSFRDIGPRAMWMLVFAVLCITLVILIYLIARKFLNRKSARKNNADEMRKDKAVEEESWIAFWADILFMGGGLFGAFFGVLVVALLSTSAGAKAAINYKKNMEKGVIKENCVEMKAPEDSFTGYLIVCSQSQCAYWNSGKTKIINLNDVKSQEIVIN